MSWVNGDALMSSRHNTGIFDLITASEKGLFKKLLIIMIYLATTTHHL